MKKTHFFSLLCIAFIAACAVITACQKSSSSIDNNTNPTQQDALALQASATADDAADNMFNDAFNNVMGVNDDAGLGAGIGVFFAAPHSNGSNGGTPVNQFGEGVD